MKETGFTYRIRLLVSTIALAILLSLPIGTAGVSAGQVARGVHSPMHMARTVHSPSQIAHVMHSPTQQQGE
jgi:hypothetical protein